MSKIEPLGHYECEACHKDQQHCKCQRDKITHIDDFEGLEVVEWIGPRFIFKLNQPQTTQPYTYESPFD